MSNALRRRAASLAIALALGWASLGAAQATAPAAAPAPPPPPDRAAGPRPDGPAPMAPMAPTARMARNIWWNGRIGGSIAMTSAQREAADAFLRTFQERARARAAEMAEVRAALKAALERGDWVAAREQTVRQARLSAETVTQQVELQIQVLSTLDSDQRRELAQKHPLVIGSPWIRGGGPAGSPREGGPRRPAR